MKKSRLCWICFCLAVVCTLFAVAVSAAIYGDLTYTVQDGEVIITECDTSAGGALFIPAQIEGYPVTSIEVEAFSDCSGLTSIEIPSSVTSIGIYAFSGCSSLTSIKIPSSVTSIGWFAFYGCSGLQNTVGNLIYIQTTDNPYFYLQGTTSTSITSCEINANCKLIGNRAFEDCSRLTTITIPSSVTSIGEYAFCDCSRLTTITIPSSVTSIGQSAFSGCSRLKAVYITDLAAWCGIRFVDGFSSNPCYYAHNLYLNNTLLTDLVIPSSVTHIGDYAFYNCSGLTSITIPSSVTSIGGNAFYKCSGLTSITILNPDCKIYDDGDTISDTATIYGYAGSTAETYAKKYHRTFVALDEVHTHTPGEIPAVPATCTESGLTAGVKCSVCEEILTSQEVVPALGHDLTMTPAKAATATASGNNAYYTCSRCGKVFKADGVTETTVEAETIPALGDVNISALTYKISDGEVTITYTSATGALIIPAQIEGYPVTSIGEYAFYDCSGLTSITIPSSVTSIGERAFLGCSGLTSIEIPSSVTSIGKQAFSYCHGLTSIEIPSSVTSIGWLGFYGCSGFTSITVDAANPAYSNDAQGVLYNKDKTTLICCPGGKTECEIPSSVTSIGEGAFSECSRLTSVTIPSSVTSIGEGAFSECSRLTSITIPSSVTSIGSGAFCNCYADVTILNPNCDIYDDVTTIEHKATIRGYPGSTAQAYANKYEIPFETLNTLVCIVVLSVLGVVALLAIILLVVKFSKRRKLQNAESNQNG